MNLMLLFNYPVVVANDLKRMPLPGYFDPASLKFYPYSMVIFFHAIGLC